jgi:PGF-CTERM protein
MPMGRPALSVVVGLLVVTSAISATGVVAEPGVSEDEYVEEVPDRDDPYFEAEANDGSWISYVNPRDEYRSPYLGDGSGKICVVLVNENGETVVGESVPDTTVTIPTGELLEWHSSADPMTVEYPLTENYDRPLDADQFGTTSDLPQGDGYLDSHCIEFHGLPEDETIEYGEAQIDGEHADDIEVVGYIQQAHEAWDSDIDPIADAESYEEAGGGWTYQIEASHGQVVVVLQLDPEESPDDEGDDGDGHGETNDRNGPVDVAEEEVANEVEESDGTDEDDVDEENDMDTHSGADHEADEMPGFGVLVALVALSIVALVRARR